MIRLHDLILSGNQPAKTFADQSLWSRFHIHTPLVKSFDLDLCHGPCDLGGIVNAIHRFNVVPVFPNLRTLSISIASAYDLREVLPAILCPTIRVLHLHIGDPEDAADPATLQILAATHSLQLEELVVYGGFDDDMTLAAVADAVAAQADLKRLRIYDVPSRITQPWTAASQLSSLEEVTFFDDYSYKHPLTTFSFELEPPEMGTRGFPSIRRLKVDGTAETLPSTLDTITSPDLADIEIMLQGPRGDHADPTSNFLVNGAIGGVGRFANIKSFQFFFPTSVASWKDFLPLLACRRLQICVLSGLGVSRIVGDQELQLMAQAWPELEELVIKDYARMSDLGKTTAHMVSQIYPGYQGMPPRVTLGGTQRLATHSPLLRRLSIAVDARSPPSETDHVIVGASLKSLELDYSWTDDTAGKAVATFISRAWPNQMLPSKDGQQAWTGKASVNLVVDNAVVGGKYGPWCAIWDQVYQNLIL